MTEHDLHDFVRSLSSDPDRCLTDDERAEVIRLIDRRIFELLYSLQAQGGLH